MKVYHVDKREFTVQRNPVKGFPFSLLDDCEVTEDPEEADWIYLYFQKETTHAVNAIARANIGTKLYKDHKDKFVTWSLCDFPEYTLTFAGIKFALSPMAGTPPYAFTFALPLHPTEADYSIAIDHAYTQECRDREKINNFCFLGRMHPFPYKRYGGRAWMEDVQKRVEKFFIRSKHSNGLLKEWAGLHREWMQRVGESKYGFCPVGGGDATMDPRLYWTMQVGAIPIISDAEFLPFDGIVDWKELAVFIPHDERETFDYMSLPMEGPEYERKRDAVIRFWDEYCFYPNCAMKLAEHYLVT